MRNEPVLASNEKKAAQLFQLAAEAWTRGNNSGNAEKQKRWQQRCDDYQQHAEALLPSGTQTDYPGLWPVFKYGGREFYSVADLFAAELDSALETLERCLLGHSVAEQDALSIVRVRLGKEKQPPASERSIGVKGYILPISMVRELQEAQTADAAERVYNSAPVEVASKDRAAVWVAVDTL